MRISRFCERQVRRAGGWARRGVSGVVELVGFTLVAVGVGLWSLPAGLITAGLLLVAVGNGLDVRGQR